MRELGLSCFGCCHATIILIRYQGYIGTYLVLGGVDVTGPSLSTIYASGCTDKVPYTAMGSGMLAAMSVLETRWKPKMDVS